MEDPFQVVVQKVEDPFQVVVQKVEDPVQVVVQKVVEALEVLPYQVVVLKLDLALGVLFQPSRLISIAPYEPLTPASYSQVRLFYR